MGGSLQCNLRQPLAAQIAAHVLFLLAPMVECCPCTLSCLLAGWTHCFCSPISCEPAALTACRQPWRCGDSLCLCFLPGRQMQARDMRTLPSLLPSLNPSWLPLCWEVQETYSNSNQASKAPAGYMVHTPALVVRSMGLCCLAVHRWRHWRRSLSGCSLSG